MTNKQDNQTDQQPRRNHGKQSMRKEMRATDHLVPSHPPACAKPDHKPHQSAPAGTKGEKERHQSETSRRMPCGKTSSPGQSPIGGVSGRKHPLVDMGTAELAQFIRAIDISKSFSPGDAGGHESKRKQQDESGTTYFPPLPQNRISFSTHPTPSTPRKILGPT